MELTETCFLVISCLPWIFKINLFKDDKLTLNYNSVRYFVN